MWHWKVTPRWSCFKAGLQCQSDTEAEQQFFFWVCEVVLVASLHKTMFSQVQAASLALPEPESWQRNLHADRNDKSLPARRKVLYHTKDPKC